MIQYPHRKGRQFLPPRKGQIQIILSARQPSASSFSKASMTPQRVSLGVQSPPSPDAAILDQSLQKSGPCPSFPPPRNHVIMGRHADRGALPEDFLPDDIKVGFSYFLQMASIYGYWENALLTVHQTFQIPPQSTSQLSSSAGRLPEASLENRFKRIIAPPSLLPPRLPKRARHQLTRPPEQELPTLPASEGTARNKAP